MIVNVHLIERALLCEVEQVVSTKGGHTAKCPEDVVGTAHEDSIVARHLHTIRARGGREEVA